MRGAVEASAVLKQLFWAGSSSSGNSCCAQVPCVTHVVPVSVTAIESNFQGPHSHLLQQVQAVMGSNTTLQNPSNIGACLSTAGCDQLLKTSVAAIHIIDLLNSDTTTPPPADSSVFVPAVVLGHTITNNSPPILRGRRLLELHTLKPLEQTVCSPTSCPISTSRGLQSLVTDPQLINTLLIAADELCNASSR